MSLRKSEIPQRVIVAGGGMAGLGTADLLAKAGRDVLVLEGQMRPGGRVHTLREGFTEGLYAEAGAMFMPHGHRLTMSYIRRFKLPLQRIARQGAGDWLYYVRGRRIRWKPGKRVRWPLALTEQEQRMGLEGMIRRYCEADLSAIGNPNEPGWPPDNLRRMASLSFADDMRRNGASPSAVKLLSLGSNRIWGDGAASYSALGLMREEMLELHLGESSLIRGGSDRLPHALASSLGGRLIYGARVVRIEHDSRSVTAVVLRNGVCERISGTHLVSAMPFSVLRGIEVAPPFSPAKQQVISSLRYTSITRVYLEMREQFWFRQNLDGRFVTGLPIGMGWSGFRRAAPDILECYLAGPDARNLDSLSEAERIESALRQLSRVFPDARRCFVRGISKSWDHDPWARGAYAWFAPGEMTRFIADIMRPEGRVHFAGDHTSPLLGWIQGALESAERVASEILSSRHTVHPNTTKETSHGTETERAAAQAGAG
jgi:monoamine oxidase